MVDAVEKIAATIWEATSDPKMKRPGMTWLQLVDAVDGNPSSWAECHERCLRQARAVLGIAVIPDPENAEMVEQIARGIGTYDGCASDEIPDMCRPGNDCVCRKQAAVALIALRDRIKP